MKSCPNSCIATDTLIEIGTLVGTKETTFETMLNRWGHTLLEYSSKTEKPITST